MKQERRFRVTKIDIIFMISIVIPSMLLGAIGDKFVQKRFHNEKVDAYTSSNISGDTVTIRYIKEKADVKPEPPPMVVDSVAVNITVFNPTAKQCGGEKQRLLCSDGSIIDPDNPQRWCGVSKDIKSFIDFGDSINLKIPQAPYLNGKWVVHTSTSHTIKRGVDLLISNPVVCNVKGSWKGYIMYSRAKRPSDNPKNK